MTVKRDETTELRVKLEAETGVLDITNPKTGDGWLGLQFCLRSGEKEITAAKWLAPKTRAGSSSWQAELTPEVKVSFEAGPSPAGGGIILRPSLTNTGSKPFKFTGYGFKLKENGVGPKLGYQGLPVFVHSENLRYENLPHSRETFPFIRPLPETTGRWYGRQGLGPMPVLILGRASKDRWLVEGAASHDRHAPSWQVTLPTAPDRMLDYRSEYFWIGGAEESVAPGETKALESTLYLLVNAPADSFYDGYIDELVALYGDRFAGPHSLLAEQPVYCTWNYGIYTSITEAQCLTRIKLAAKTQGGGIFQLDHGYQPPHEKHLSWGHMDAYYPDTSLTWDKTKFPGGPHRIVEECKKHGLEPAIWWTPRMDVGGPISQEHPEWIAVNKAGNPIEHVGDLHPDYSVPEMRAFIERSIRTVIHDWGFTGIKLDFFSWAFDAPDLVFRNGGTNVAWKRWLLAFIRKELGPRGYFLHCVSCPMGNPFLAIDGCDSFRAGADIDHGGWENNIGNCGWILASFPSSGKRTWFADMDSFMGNPQYPTNERRFRTAMGYMTSGMVDISGPIEKFNAAAIADYRLISERCDQGGKVLIPDRGTFFGRPLPRILARLHPSSSRTRKEFGIQATIGLFNWEATPQTFAVSLAQLGLGKRKVRARDFWTGKAVALPAQQLVADLAPRQHVLVDILA